MGTLEVLAFLGRIAIHKSGCWEWQGARRGGTGRRNYGGFGCTYAHRWSYEYFIAPIPEGLEIDHLCRNTLCVNPQHLEVVTRHENTMRGLLPAVQRARHARKTQCPQGHPYDLKNTYYRKDRPFGGRLCKECGRIRLRVRRARLRELVA